MWPIWVNIFYYQTINSWFSYMCCVKPNGIFISCCVTFYLKLSRVLYVVREFFSVPRVVLELRYAMFCERVLQSFFLSKFMKVYACTIRNSLCVFFFLLFLSCVGFCFWLSFSKPVKRPIHLPHLASQLHYKYCVCASSWVLVYGYGHADK